MSYPRREAGQGSVQPDAMALSVGLAGLSCRQVMAVRFHPPVPADLVRRLGLWAVAPVLRLVRRPG